MLNSYAAQILRQKHIKIYANGKRILNQDYRLNYPKLKTVIKKDSDFVREQLSGEGIYEIRDYIAFKNMGFKLIKYQPKANFFPNQRIAYMIVRINYYEESWQVVKDFPKGHYIVYDAVNKCIMGVGKNFSVTGKTNWTSTKFEGYVPEYIREYGLFDGTPPKVKKSFLDDFYHREQEFNFEIPEGVIGITQDGAFCCIPKPVKTDPHLVFIFGGKRSGKSMLLNLLEDIDHHKFKLPGANIHDVKAESKTRCLTWGKGRFLDDLHRFGELSIPKPCVYLHPTTDEDYSKVHEQEVGFDVSLPLKQLLKDDKLITYNSEWDMKGSATQLAWRNLIRDEGSLRRNGLAFVESSAEGYALIDKMIRDKGMNSKAKRVISDIFNTNLVDKSSGAPSRWVVKTVKRTHALTPWVACMYSGLFPYIITKSIRKRELWFALWLRYVIEDILEFAEEQNSVVNIYLDEIEELLMNPITRQIIQRAVRECAQKHVGIKMVNHTFKYVKDAIYVHSTGMSSYKFVFNTAEQDLINQLKKEGLTKEQAADIKKLKQFQCYAFGDFILYDIDGNKYSNEGQPLKIIRTKPPNCMHYGG